MARSFGAWIMAGVISISFPAGAEDSALQDGKEQGRAGHPLRMVVFGDSTTAPRGKLKVYADQLADMFPSVEIINKGVPGDTTEAASRRFQSDVLDQKPDLVVVQFGINDSMIDVWKTPPREASRVSLEKYRENLRAFVIRIREGGGRVVLMTPNQLRWTPTLREKYGRAPYDLSKPGGLTIVLDDYAQAVRDIASQLHVPLVDIYSLYATEELKGSPCAELLPDGMHPSEEAHKQVAERLAQVLRETDSRFR